MGGAYSSDPVSGAGSSGGVGGQTSGGNGSGGASSGVAGRFPDGRSSSSSSSNHPLLDQSSFPWLGLARSGQVPPSSGVGTPSMRTQPQLPQQQPQQPQLQQQQNPQPSIEELIANFSRANPNFLYSFLENLRAQQQQQQQQQHYQQGTSQSQILGAQLSQTAASRSRSPIHHQQSPQTGVPRPSSGSLSGIANQSASGRPGSATSTQFAQARVAGGNNVGNIKYAGSAGQSQQQSLPEQLVSAAAAAAAATYPHRPSSSASGSLRSSITCPVPTYPVLTTNSAQYHSAYAGVAAAAHLPHNDNLQDLTRGGGQSMGSGGGIPSSKRPRLVSSSSSSVPSTVATPSSSPYLPQPSSLSRQQQQHELLSRQLLQNAANNRTAILALFTNAAQQQQQQVTASGARSSVSSGYYPPSESYGQRNAGQRQPGSQLLVSSPNALSQTPSSSSSVAAAAAAAAAYSNLAAVAAVAAAAQQHAASSPAVAASNTGVYQQQVAASGRSSYLHAATVSSSTSSRGGYRGQSQQSQSTTIPTGVSSSVSYHPHTTTHTMPSGTGVLRQQTKEPAYHPQVEAISPAPEEARLLDSVEVKLHREREEMQRRLHEIEARINKEESHLRYLMDRESSLTADLKNETSAPPPNSHRTKSLSVTELEDERAYENPIQALLSETRSRAKKQHESLARLCGRSVSAYPCALPVYRQPSDLSTLRHVHAGYKNGFRRQLIKYIHRRKRAERARLRILAKHYARHAQAFFKRHEKLVNSVKHKQKDAKNREIFDKAFPEMKKIREDQGQKDGKGDDGHDTGSNAGSNGVEGDQMYDFVEDTAKMKEYAIDPPVTLAPWERSYHFLCTAHRIIDPKSEHLRAQSLEKWSKEDKLRFKERFLATPKNFTTIAASLDKSVAECIHYYYLSKKSEGYKALVKKHSTSRRRRAGHSDKNGPTGPSHGTASKKAPFRVSTPAGDDHRNSPHHDSKNEDGHTTVHRKGGGSGGSTRGRSGRRGGSGDHRSAKGSGKGRSGTPVPTNVQTTSSSTSGQPDAVTMDNQPASAENEKRQSSVSASKSEENKDNLTALGKAIDSTSVKTPSGSSQPVKEMGELGESNQDGSKPNDESSSSDGRVAPVSSLVYFHKLIKQNVEKVYASGVAPSIQLDTEATVTAEESIPVVPMDSCRGYTTPHNNSTGITDTINLTHGSPTSGTSSPNSHPEELVVNQSTFSDFGGPGSSVLPPKDAVTASCLAAGLSEQLANLAKGAVAAGNISPEFLASIPQLSAAVASSGVYGTQPSSGSTQALSQVTQSMNRGGGSQSPIQKQSPDCSTQPSDPAATAYSKAILIGDFCTAQQLSRDGTPSQQIPMPTSANMTGTGLHRAADYTDPTYLNGRTIDPSTLPMPTKRLGPGGFTGPSSRSMGYTTPQGHLRSAPVTGVSGYHHQPPPPPPPPPTSRHRQGTLQPSSGIDPGMLRQGADRSLSTPQGGGYGLQSTYGDTAANKSPGYYDLTAANPPKKNITLESTVSGRGSGNLDPKVEEYINHAAKLYRDEVERYTSRDRSDSMRTRTSSETSQQMHTALDNARQRVLGMAAAAAAAATTETGNPTTGYNTPSAFVDSVSNDPTCGMVDINEMLAKYGQQYISLLAAFAADASSCTTTSTAPTAATQEAIPLFAPRTCRPSLMDGSVPPQALPLQTSSASSPFASTQPHVIPQTMPLPRYRKSAGGSSANTAATASATGANIGPTLSQRDFFPTVGEDNVSFGGFHVNHQQHHRYPTLMRASASRNLDSTGLLPEELARKSSTACSRSQQPPSSLPQSHLTNSQAMPSTSISNNPSLAVSSSSSSSTSASSSSTTASVSVTSNLSTIGSFRSPEVPDTGITLSTSSVTPSIASVNPSTSSIGTLGDQIEKAITDGIIVQKGGQDTPQINPSTAEAKSVKSIHPSSSLLKTDSENLDLSPLLASTTRSSSTGLLTSPLHIPSSLLVFPKKRSRVTSSSSAGMSIALSTSPTRSHEADMPTEQSSSAVTPPPSASPASAEERQPSSKSPITASATPSISSAPMASGISAISPPSSAESPGNLQICIPPEDEQLQYSPNTPDEGASAKPSSLSRQMSNSRSSNIAAARKASPRAICVEAASPRHNLPSSSSAPPSQ